MDYKPQVLDLIDSFNHQYNDQKPSEWAEDNRIMGKSVTSMPGPFRFHRTPYLREPLDCLSLDSDARIIAVQKGVQIGFSSGVIENGICWIISQQPGNIMLLARDDSLVKIMMDTRIDPAIDGTGIRHLIVPNTLRKRNQRTGDTSKGKEFTGGMLMSGSVMNPAKMRQVSIQYGFIDDFEAAPLSDKDAGSTTSLIETRFASFYKKMKLFYISTPESKQTSNIEPVYELGDKRRYNIPCPCCGEMIVLEWELDGVDGEKAGITWKVDNKGDLISGSVGYTCQKCGDFFDDSRKGELLNAGEWIPTQKPSENGYRSYHISSLYSPSTMYDWEHYVRQWLNMLNEVDPGRKHAAKKTFYNTVLGLTWEEETEKPEAKNIAGNTRGYPVGTVPTKTSVNDGNGKIVLLTCACDLNGRDEDARLDYEITAWSESGASYSVQHGSVGTFVRKRKDVNFDSREKFSYFHGASKSVWPIYKDIISREYPTEDEGVKMTIAINGVDTGNWTELAYTFIEECNPPFMVGLKGKDKDKFKRHDSNIKRFVLQTDRSDCYLLNVNSIKDDISNQMQLKWDGGKDEKQPYGYMNFPAPTSGKYGWKNYFSHFEAEEKKLHKNPEGEFVSSRWEKKTSSSDNHLYDCRVYNIALKEIITHLICKEYKVQNPDWKKYCQLIAALSNG